MMGEGGQTVEAEHGAGALEGVEGAEHAIHQRPIIEAMLEIEQALLHLLQQFAGFDAENVRGIRIGHLARTFCTRRTS